MGIRETIRFEMASKTMNTPLSTDNETKNEIQMDSENSNLPIEDEDQTENDVELENSNLSTNTPNNPFKYLNLFKFVKDEYPDCPQMDDNMSKEDFHNAILEYLKSKGFRQRDDFSDVEKAAIVEECMVNLTDIKVLSQKYNTMTCIIKGFVQDVGFRDSSATYLAQFPDYPKKTDEMSLQEYYKIVK